MKLGERLDKFTIREAAIYLGVSEEKVYHWTRSNRLETCSSFNSNRILIAKKILEDFKLTNSKELSFLKKGVPKGFFTVEMLARRFNVKRDTINLWIKKNIFKNIEKSGVPYGSPEYYLIPETDVIEYEREINDIEERYIKSTVVQETLGISAGSLYILKKKGYFEDSIIWKGKLYLSKSSVVSLKKKLDLESQMLSTKELSENLGVSVEQVLKIFRPDLQLSLRGGKFLLSKENFENFVRDNGDLLAYKNKVIPKGYYNTNMLAQYFNVNQTEIVRWINQGRFDGIRKFRDSTSGQTSIFLIPESSVRKYEEFLDDLNKNYVTPKQAMDILNVSSSTIGNWINNKKISGGILWFHTWYLPLKEIKGIISQNLLLKKLISCNKAAELLGVSRKTIKKCLELNLFKVTIIQNKVYLSREELETLPDDFFKKLKSNYNLYACKIKRPEGYLTIKEVAEKLNISYSSASELINNGKLGTPIEFLENGKKLKAINLDEMKLYITKLEKKSEKQKHCLNASDAARYLNIHSTTLSSYIKKGYFPNGFKENNYFYIPLTDLEEYKRIRNLSKLPNEKGIKIDKAFLLEHLIHSIKNFKIPKHIEKTREYYIDYISVRISSLNGHISSVKSECSRAKICYEKIILNLTNECFELSEEEIHSILIDESYALSHRTLVNWFFQYVFGILGIDNKKNFIITPSSSTKDDEKEIYSPEIYLEYLSYTKNIDRHVLEALKSKHYANMWLFTIMHLIDAWRSTDIVNSLKNIELEAVEINDFEWFLTNKVTKEQAQIVINQIYYKTRSLTTSKTNSLLTFLVPMDFILAAGNAFIICELHRRHTKDEFLLQTLISNSLRARKPNNQHLNFFKYNEDLRDFKSLVMNRSTMTYLFNSIVDEAPDPELALTYTQQTRSHEKEDTTAIYVKATNFDGSLGNVSLNLFNRGHFGWLYNTLIKLLFEDGIDPIPIDVRSHYIMELRKEFSPKQIEDWAVFLKNIDKKRLPILNKLSKLNNLQIKELINGILSGKRPSRNEHGSCLSYPDCEKPHLQSCYSCEFFIPEVYTIIHIKQEIENLMTSIESTRYTTIIERDSYFLKIYLLLLNEAISVYGEKYIETFIDLVGIRKRVLQLSPLLM
ncbi:helix-turn-helix domain-containing protein [Solibacillus isronensis]|uniref:helix-turn-helix domain-containing protein n=1 Tax=Solibacillus isronensis TaxID=412383 RepID=UPI0039A1025F